MLLLADRCCPPSSSDRSSFFVLFEALYFTLLLDVKNIKFQNHKHNNLLIVVLLPTRSTDPLVQWSGSSSVEVAH